MAASLLPELLSGSVFGAALLAAGVYSPSVIKSQLRFSSFHMLETMLGASASTAFVFQIADRLKLMPLRCREPSSLGLFPFDGNVLGGALIGLGMALTGACPGTVLVQLSLGLRSGLFVAIGGILGGIAYVTVRPSLHRFRETREKAKQNREYQVLAQSPPPKSNTVPASLGLEPTILLLVWVPLCVLLVRIAKASEQSLQAVPQAGLIPPAYSGILIGGAQVCSVLLTKRAIGVSTAYEDIGRWILQFSPTRQKRKAPKRHLLTPAVVFASGIALAGVVLGRIVLPSDVTPRSNTLGLQEAGQAVVGGLLMVLGARVAGGCTSGHAISGLATFSWSSVVTTGAMFGSGAAIAGVLR